MAKEDEEKTTFITSQGIFCYSKMTFGLKNAGETYQRLVDKAFQKQIGRNLEVYVDDLVIKSSPEQEIITDIEETFKTLREINMKLNPKKCTFGIEEGMFMGYKVNTKGIKVCPDKVEAVLGLPSPKYLREVQKLNGKLASLNRPRISVKGQILADFIVERPEDDSPAAPMEVEEELSDPWTLFTDGSFCVDGSGARLILTSPEEQIVEEEGNTWMTPIYEYLTEETLPAERKKVRAVRIKSRRYAVINGEKSMKDPAACTRDQALRLRQASANQRLGEKSKQKLGRRIKGTIREKKQGLDGRSPARPMGTPYHDQVKQWGHSVLFDLRNRSSDSDEN
ncbi:reverse transcriptase domain-containing protein [Tanacetum coccineum]